MAHEFDGNKYEKASTHQKEWGAKVLADLALKGNNGILIWDAATAPLPP